MVWFDEMDVRPRQGAFLYGYNNEKIRIWTSAMPQPRKEIILKKIKERKKTKKKNKKNTNAFAIPLLFLFFAGRYHVGFIVFLMVIL